MQATTLITALACLVPSSPVSGTEKDQCREQATPQIAVFRLARLSAGWAAKRLTARFGREARVMADEETNTLYIQGSAANVERARNMLRRMDSSVPGRPPLRMVSLKSVKAGLM